MRNANHYARTPELADLRPADRVPVGMPGSWSAEADRRMCLASEVTKDGGLPVVANHGRWVVECPCGGAQLTHPGDPRFMCVDCGNADNGHRWRPVIWPEDWREIETALEVRTKPYANYQPGVDDLERPASEQLAAENKMLEPIGGLR